MSLLISLLVVIVIAAVAFWLIDRGFTGDAATFAWIAKLVVAVIGLLAVLNLLGYHF